MNREQLQERILAAIEGADLYEASAALGVCFVALSRGCFPTSESYEQGAQQAADDGGERGCITSRRINLGPGKSPVLVVGFVGSVVVSLGQQAVDAVAEVLEESAEAVRKCRKSK